MPLKQEWSDLCRELINADPDYKVSSREAHRNVQWGPIAMEEFTDLKGFELSKLNYTDRKISQLTKYYFNEASLEKAIDKFSRRVEKKSKNSFSFSFHGTEKKFTANDFCMNSGILSYMHPGWDLTILYRTTELFQKFRGDLIFLNQVIIPKLDGFDAELTEITFYFPHIIVHPMYFVYWLHMQDNWSLEMTRLRINKLIKYKSYLRNIGYLLGNRVSKFKSAQRISDWVKRDKKFTQFLEEELKEYGGLLS